MQTQIVSSAMHLVHAVYLSTLYLVISLSVHPPPYNIAGTLWRPSTVHRSTNI